MWLNSLLQYFRVGCLGVSEVHELVQQLVHNNEVVPDALLLYFLEVLDKRLEESGSVKVFDTREHRSGKRSQENFT